jgi:hypothetical protein
MAFSKFKQIPMPSQGANPLFLTIILYMTLVQVAGAA